MSKFKQKSNWRWRIAQAAEIRWWQNYLKEKDPEVYLDWKRNYWRQFLEEIKVSVPEKSRILDAGCGPAGIFTILGKQKVTALDPLLDQYKNKLEHFRPSNYPNCDFVNQALEQFEDDLGFDLIFCLNAINHVDNIYLAMDRLVALLRPGGQLILSVDAHRHAWLKLIFKALPGDILHPHQYDLSEYEEFVKQKGLQLEQAILKDRQLIFDYYIIKSEKP